MPYGSSINFNNYIELLKTGTFFIIIYSLLYDCWIYLIFVIYRSLNVVLVPELFCIFLFVVVENKRFLIPDSWFLIHPLGSYGVSIVRIRDKIDCYNGIALYGTA